MRDPLALAQDEIERSTDWFDSLDRSGLGIHVTMKYDMVVIHASNAIRENTLLSETERGEALKEIGELAVAYRDRKNLPIFGPEDGVKIMAELALWDKRAGFHIDPKLMTIAVVVDRLAFLENIMLITDTVPDSLPYVNAGVFDRAVIEHCLTNDIDPELATKV